MMIPDLRREDSEISLEHCSVLLERTREALTTAYPDDLESLTQVCDVLNPETMKHDFEILFTTTAFMNLFKSQFGKGVLVGALFSAILNEEEDEMEDV